MSWSWRQDLNLQPPDYKSGALPIELRQRISEPNDTIDQGLFSKGFFWM